MKSQLASYHGYRFPPDIISHAVWLYHRFCLSFRDTEDLLAQRGVTITYETIRQWWRSDRSGVRAVATAPTRGVVARIVTGPHDAHRQDPHRPMRYDTGRPRAVIRFRIAQPRTASLPCPAGLRARRPSPMMDVSRKHVFSTRP